MATDWTLSITWGEAYPLIAQILAQQLGSASSHFLTIRLKSGA